ncbi:ribosome hibernation-promoting factor, HPF/YfiA family [Actomonas aquatica]|uniref:Ribosome-associated translation inhibitor RaiA n=1 Tax=Actomonas aquatica TaxID=2866162 RepID=A0ABZ1C7B7_9BACT|nr:ribosome-associated translation inhibitor RaiA [Opitutus sp. WL0086]WRQ86409.1 ribosome-associated translation inhibitor RaiA [Opitutus sp. WL0086]
MIPSDRSFHRFGERLSATGVHLHLTDAMRHHIVLKAGRLLRHQPRIDWINLEVIHDQTRAADQQFVVKGRVEVKGPDLFASASADDAYKAINQAVSRLDRALRKRATAFEARQRQALAPHWSERASNLSIAP